jgi:alpha-L-arabinofuranosidase
MFGQSAGQYYYGDCVTIENPDTAPRWQGLPEGEESGYLQGQSVVLNVKTRQLFVKLCNAGDQTKKANINLSRFKGIKTAVKTTISGQPNDENNYDKQPIAPKTETINLKSKMTMELTPYSFVMLQIQL